MSVISDSNKIYPRKYERAKTQLHKLNFLNFLGNIHIASAAWVALLASRGFSMKEIMLAETVFHIVSGALFSCLAKSTRTRRYIIRTQNCK